MGRRVFFGASMALTTLDKIPDHSHGALGRIRDHGVPAIRKSLELNQMRR
jgi:hypothetical protein